MSDLISRSELYMNDLIRRKDVLALFPINDCSDKMVGLYERVLDIPTAYDKDKVLHELREVTKEDVDCSYREDRDNVYDKSWNDDIISASEAFEIVRKGGV